MNSSRRWSASRGKTPDWVRLSRDALLDLRLCDLKVRVEGTPLEERITKLYDEMDARGLRFRPHVWLSNEWFTPVDVPGFAIPFYLAHPRLTRLERTMMLEVEGGTRDSCLRILRHEAGHAIDHAYGLSRRPRWRRIFGNPGRPYPDSYQPRPYSKRFVLHIDNWYAQSHPSEDFAETFAVWLTPGSQWRRRYQGWAALRKLEYVDTLMAEIAERPALVSTRRQVDQLSRLRTTLREHYRDRQERYGSEYPDFYDRDLRRLFSAEGKGELASSFLRRHRAKLRRLVAQWTGEYQYTIDQVLGEMIVRCRALKLRVELPEVEAIREMAVLLTVQTMNHLSGGRQRFLL